MASIDGLGSGLDTTTIVAQLVAIERQPQDRLVSQRLAILSRGTAWNQIGVGLQSIVDAAAAITKAGVLGGATGTSSTPGTATATVTAGAQPGRHTLSVQALATAGSYSRGVASSTAAVGAGTLLATRGTSAVGISGVSAPTAANGNYSVEVRSVDGASAEVVVNGVSTTVDTSSGSFEAGGLQFDASALVVGKAEVTVARTTSATATVADLAAQLNAAGGVASASVITTTDALTGTSSTRLLLSARDTGSAGAVSTSTSGLSGLDPQTTVRAAGDARFTLDGLADITRSSNSVSDLLPGVTLGLVAAGTPETTITVAKDPTSAAAAVKTLVGALNSTFATITTNTKYDVASKKGGPLTTDSAARRITAQLQDAVSTSGQGTAATLGSLGIKLDRNGTYTFDEAAFSASLAKDPNGTAEVVTRLTTSLTAIGKAATAETGVTKTSAASVTVQARRMQDQIDAFGARLALTEVRIRKTWTDLDAALGSLKSQGSWLTGQLSSLQ